MATSFMQLFWDLSSTVEEERVQSALLLLNEIKEGRADLDYCVGRLVKGLASNRKGARHGYFTALCEVLSMSSSVSVDNVLRLIKKHMQHNGGLKAQDERGVYFGHVFTLLALIQSGRLVDPEDVLKVAKELVTLWNQKSFLQELCAVGLSLLLKDAEETVVRSFLPNFESKIRWEKCSPELLYLMLCLQKRFFQSEWFQDLLTDSLDCSKLHEPCNFDKMAELLKDSSKSHPNLHVVWTELLPLVRQNNFDDFWEVVVEGNLLPSSHERRYLALKLVETLLPSLTVSEVEVVFSPGVIRCVINNLHKKGNLLSTAANHFLEHLTNEAVLLADSGVVVEIILQLLARVSRFDALTKTDTIKKLKERVSPSSLLSYTQSIMKSVSSPLRDSTDSQSTNKCAIRKLQNMGRSYPASKSVLWMLPAAKFLLFNSVFTGSCTNLEVGSVSMITPPSDEVKMNCRSSLLSLLTELSATRSSGETTDAPWYVELACYAQDLLSSPDVVPAVEFPEKFIEVWQSAMSLARQLKGKEELQSAESAFLLLISVVSLESLWETERNQHILEELVLCHSNMAASLVKTPRKKGKSKTIDWVEVLIDQLLELLSRPMQLWKNVVKRAFQLVSCDVSSEALQLIVNALQPQNINELMEDEDEVSECEDDDDDDDEDSSSDEEEDENMDDALGSQFYDADAEMRAEIREALGTLAVCDSDQSSIGDSSMDEEIMETVDEALSAVFRRRAASSVKKRAKADSTTVMYFRMRILDLVEVYVKKQSTNEAIFDLLVPLVTVASYVGGKTVSSPLSNRAASVLDKLCHVKRCPSELNSHHVHDVLEELLSLLQKGRKSGSHFVSSSMFIIKILRRIQPIPAISPLATRSARKRKQLEAPAQPSIVKTGVLDVDRVTKLFSSSLQHAVTKKNSNVPFSIFKAYIERHPDLAWELFNDMVKSLPLASSSYKKVEVCNLMILMLAQKVPAEVVSNHLSACAHQLQQVMVDNWTSQEDLVQSHLKPTLTLTIKLIKTLRAFKDKQLVLPQLASAAENLSQHPSVSPGVCKMALKVAELCYESTTTGSQKKRKMLHNTTTGSQKKRKMSK